MSNPFRPRGGILVITPPPPKAGAVEFAAPVGCHVRWSTRIIFALAGGVVVLCLGFALATGAPLRRLAIMTLTPLATTAILVPVAIFSQVLGYRLEADELVVRRRNRETRFALADLQSVEVDPKAMSWSVQVLGNDGLGAITGRFRNCKLGAFQALVTDRARAVVLRWPGRCLVVSPDRPEEFAAAVRARTRTRRTT